MSRLLQVDRRLHCHDDTRVISRKLVLGDTRGRRGPVEVRLDTIEKFFICKSVPRILLVSELLVVDLLKPGWDVK